MPNKRIPEFTELTTVADGDKLYIVDVSDVTDDATGSSRHALAKNVRGIPQTAAETTAGVTPTNYQYEPGNVLRYGTNTTPGTTVMTTAAQAALDQAVESGGAPAYFPADNYLIDATLTVVLTGANDNERIRIYGDGAKSIITSTVLGATTLDISDADLVIVERLRFVGNNLTGASGNGHAIAFRDTLPQSGTFYPQQCDVRDISVKQFRGDDTETTNTTTGVATTAAGVYMGPGLGNYIKRVSISTCGIGILLDACENTHISDSLVTKSDEYGIECDSVSDGCSIQRCDLTQNGVDANLDPVVQSGVINYSSVGIIGTSANSQPVTVKDCKIKVGQAITVNAANGALVQDCFIRVDPPDTITETWAIQAFNFDRIAIEGNEFDYLLSAGNTSTRNAMDLDMNANHACNIIVNHNSFIHANDVGFDIRIKGASAGSSNIGLECIGNKFGSSRNGRTTATVTDCVIFTVCNVKGIFAGNVFTVLGDGASAGGTITDCLDVSGAASLTNNQLVFAGNRSVTYLAGGTITNTIETSEVTFGPFVHAGQSISVQGSTADRGEVGQIALVDITSGVARFASYDWDASAWKPVQVKGQTVVITANGSDLQFKTASETTRATLTDLKWQVEVPQFMLERASALADIAGYGQFWIENTTPNQPRFTNDAGTDFDIATSSATTGGTSSAGAGNQYIEINVGGTTYKVLHDGTV